MRLPTPHRTTPPDLPPPAPETARRSLVALAALVAAPWTWFLGRDAVGPIGALRTPVVTAREIVALLLPHLVVATLVVTTFVGCWRRLRRAALVALSLVLFGLAAIVAPWRPVPGPAPLDPVRVVVVNPEQGNDRPPGAADVVAQDGDVVVVAEPSGVGRLVARSYPHVIDAYETGGDGVVSVLSRFPLRREDIRATFQAAGVFRFVVDAPSGPFVLYAAHPDPPGLGAGKLSPVEQERLFGRLVASVRQEELPVVVAGDLNLIDRSAPFRRLTDVLVDATGDHWRRPTSLKWPLFLARIDHVLVSRGWCGGDATTYRITGSDHLGVAADVGRCP